MTEPIARALVALSAALPPTVAIIAGAWALEAGHEVGGPLVTVGTIAGVFSLIVAVAALEGM